MRQVRLIDDEGNQLGILDTREAIALARSKDLDLVLVGATAVPPVCKLMDYGRFRYEEQQNEKENRKRARHQEVKSIKFRVKIDDNDFRTKTNHVKRFLEEGHKVKVTIMFRGRERTHPELGERILLRVAEDVKELGAPESMPSIMGMDMNMIVAPNPNRVKKGEEAITPSSAASSAEPEAPSAKTPVAETSEAVVSQVEPTPQAEVQANAPAEQNSAPA